MFAETNQYIEASRTLAKIVYVEEREGRFFDLRSFVTIQAFFLPLICEGLLASATTGNFGFSVGLNSLGRKTQLLRNQSLNHRSCHPSCACFQEWTFLFDLKAEVATENSVIDPPSSRQT
jgi:hypothetical protein